MKRISCFKFYTPRFTNNFFFYHPNLLNITKIKRNYAYLNYKDFFKLRKVIKLLTNTQLNINLLFF